MRVAVAMSGGVDSAVAAAFLREEGHEVIAITLRLADLSACGLGASRCCSPGDLEIAGRVAWQLGISHTIIDMADAFRGEVLGPFVDAYLAGETPSPCARCNARVKLGGLVELLGDLGADALATGHYARLVDVGPERHLLRGLDKAKDQSYFLFELGREHLNRLIFPLGSMGKDEVRRRARELGLPNAARSDSQEVCFVPEGGSYLDVLARLAPERLPEGGEIIDTSGRVIGQHDGVHHFTIGQRRGIGVADRRRLYVVGIEPTSRRVIVGDQSEAGRHRLELREVNWLAVKRPATLTVAVQVRSRHRAQPARITFHDEGRATVEFEEPCPAPAAGQAAVCYDGDRVLGGGWIDSTASTSSAG